MRVCIFTSIFRCLLPFASTGVLEHQNGEEEEWAVMLFKSIFQMSEDVTVEQFIIYVVLLAGEVIVRTSQASSIVRLLLAPLQRSSPDFLSKHSS